MNMQVSANEIANIKLHEGTSYNPYYDVKGYAIGTGHNPGASDVGDYSVLIADLNSHGIYPDTTSGGPWINDDNVNTLLQYDLINSVNAVNNGLTRAVSQNAFDALVDFAYGAGVGAVTHPIADINLGDYQSAANYIASYVHDQYNNVIPALVPLRAATAATILADANYTGTSEAGFTWIPAIIITGIALGELYKYAKRKRYVR